MLHDAEAKQRLWLNSNMHGEFCFCMAVGFMRERELTVKWTCMVTTSAASFSFSLKREPHCCNGHYQ